MKVYEAVEVSVLTPKGRETHSKCHYEETERFLVIHHGQDVAGLEIVTRYPWGSVISWFTRGEK